MTKEQIDVKQWLESLSGSNENVNQGIQDWGLKLKDRPKKITNFVEKIIEEIMEFN